MSTIKELNPLAEFSLNSLINITKYDQSLYLTKEKSHWCILAHIGEIPKNHTYKVPKQYLEKIMYRNDVNQHQNLLGVMDVRSFLSIPINSRDHKGLLIVYSKGKNEYIDNYQKEDILPYFREQLTHLIDNLIHYQSLQLSATYDYLTNVLNRRYFSEEARDMLNTTLKHNRNVSILLIDIDHFKRVNDT